MTSLRSLPLLLLAASLTLTGCEMGTTATTSVNGLAVRGLVHGGQQPVSQSHVYLMAAATSGYGASSTSLLNAGSADGTDSVGSYVLTSSTGEFSITGDYSCTSNQQLYILALGGNPGLTGTNINNTQIGLMAPLGLCSAVSSSTYVQINEVSTVAMAYALAGFASSPTQIASATTTLSQKDLANAFAMVGNLESAGATLATTPGGNGTVPLMTINTLADILSACVNTSSSTSSACTTLIANAASSGTTGTAPATVAQAALNMAHNPGKVGISTMFGLVSASSAFQPALPAAPADTTISITYTASGLTGPGHVSVDGTGNVWIPDHSGALIELSPLGAQLSPTNGFSSGSSIIGSGSAVDSLGNVWATGGGGVMKFSSSGTYVATYTAGNPPGNPFYDQIAVDPSNNIWLANTADLGSYAENGTTRSPSTGWETGAYVTDARSDSSGNIWLTDKDGYLREVNSSGTELQAYTDGSRGANAPVGLAIDASNNIWVADSNLSSISKFTSGGTQTTYTGGGTNDPYSMNVDGAGAVWVINLGGAVSAFSNTGTVLTPSAGYAISVGTGLPFGALDGSGNLWVTSSTHGNIVQFVGLTTPVVTPITPSKLGVKP